MLGIIFTRKRLFAGWITEDGVKWLTIGTNGKNFVKHQGNLFATLQLHYFQILDAVQWQAFGNGMTPLDSPPLALVFPGDEQYITIEEKQIMLSWLMASPIRWASIQMSDTMSLLAQSLPHRYVNFLLFEAFDEGASMKSNLPHIQAQCADFDFKILGKNEGIKNIFSIILSEISKKDILFSENQQNELWEKLENYDVNKKLIINQLDTFPRLTLDVTLSQSRYFDLLTFHRNTYYNILIKLKIFDILNISIIFASDLYDNSVFSDFVSHISESSLLNFNEILFYDDKKSFEFMLLHLFKLTHQIPSYDGKLTKSKLIAEIKAKCTDRRKFKEYFSKYTPIAQELGMPLDVLNWYLRQNLYGLSPLSSIGDVIQADFSSKKKIPESKQFKTSANEAYQTKPSFSNREKTEAVTEFKSNSVNATSPSKATEPFQPKHATSIQYNLNPIYRVLDDYAMQTISLFATFEKELPSQEFIYFKGKLKDGRKQCVFRMLKNNNDIEAVNAFTFLHERELSYYNEKISPILETPTGEKYYFRDYIEGETLTNYVKRVGLNKKYKIKELNAIDLELLLELWRVIYNLKFHYQTLTKESFIVTTHWRLPFKRELEVNLINFDTTTNTQELMEQKLTQIFEELFGENLTNEFRTQFQNT
jgi:hypothetical protein